MNRVGNIYAVILLTFLGAGFARPILAGNPAPLSSNLPAPVRVQAVGQRSVPVSPKRTPVTIPQALVGANGVYLAEILSAFTNVTVPHVRVCDSPVFGQSETLTANRILDFWQKASPDNAPTNVNQVSEVRVARKSRLLDEVELRDLLTADLQKLLAQDRGELELRLGRTWTPLPVPEEPIELRFLDLPPRGLQTTFIARFEIKTERETVGTWQMSLQARLLKPIWVTRTALNRGQLVTKADVALEKRDILSLREPLCDWSPESDLFECVNYLPAGSPLLARSARPRYVIHRGDILDALVQDGPMTISIKVQALEEGTRGQTIRVRNLASKKELRGKVENEQSILVNL